ncbi:MAG: iron-sulfur cluster assembly protein [Actinomycetota bacterium]|nr:iron-sulfur cluster assembly protein [Actinomycetota bacterium]
MTTFERVRAAIASVDDPEYPGISVVDLGLLETLDVTLDGHVVVGLIPTFSGCPALSMIANDVRAVVGSVDDVSSCDVRWLGAPAWTVDRVTAEARQAMAREFTVAVRIGVEPVSCPRCDAPTTETSLFGPSRCRAVHSCPACSEVVEVMRSSSGDRA